MTQAASARPFCAEVARAAGEPLAATASRVEHWLLVQYGGYWPKEPLEAAVFSGPLRERLAAHLAARRRSRLLLTKPARRAAHTTTIEVVHGRTTEGGATLRRLELERHEDLLRLDLAEDAGDLVDHPLLLVCTHGIRDRCCARYGQALLTEVARQADPAWVRQATHVGGDRFAGNLVVLPEGLYYGRVERDDVAAILAAHGEGRIALPNYRGRSCYPFAVQAAERHVRAATGLTRIGDLRLRSVRRDASERFTVELLAEATQTAHEVEVAVERGEPAFLTCKSHERARPRHYVVRAHRERHATDG